MGKIFLDMITLFLLQAIMWFAGYSYVVT